jgi:hypothetical protein
MTGKIKIFYMKNCIKYIVLITIILMVGCAKADTQIQPDDNVRAIRKNPKKGACLTTAETGWDTKIKALNASWHYSWGAELNILEPESVEFVPMIWGAWSDTVKIQQKLDNILVLKNQKKTKYLLGFNEPDQAKQANMSVETALAYWPKLAAIGLPLGSPAAANPTGDWMKSFMLEAGKRNFRIDFVCVHWYGGLSVSGFLSRLKEIHDLYNRPIWITEFAPADWNATSVATSKYSKSDILTFMKEALPALDNLDYVQRYAWFSASETSAPLGNAALFDSSGKLTTLGNFYSNFEGKTN